MVRSLIGCSILALWLAGCGGAPAGPTEVPSTPTPTAVPTLAPVGFPSNPLQLVVVPADEQAAESLEADLEAILLQATNVSLDVVIAGQPAAAVEAICGSFGIEEGMAAGWVDGLTYATIFEQRCGTAAVQYARDGETREMGILLTNRNFADASLAVLTQRPLCRLSFDDYHSWVALSLMLYAEGLDPAALDTRDYDTPAAMLEAIDAGDCASGMVAQSVWEAWDAANANRIAENRRTVAMPIGILVLPFAAPESARLAITAGLNDFDEAAVLEAIAAASGAAQPQPDGTQEATAAADLAPNVDVANTLTAFFGEGTFAPVEANTFDDWFAHLESLGLYVTAAAE